MMLALGVAQAQTVYVTIGDNIATSTEADLDLAMKLIADGDAEALESMAAQARVIVIAEGIECYLEDTIWIGKVKMRVKGTVDTFFYTVMEAIREK